MSQITLRNIPEPVNHKLRDLAKQTGQSINRTILEVLKKGLGLSDAPPAKKRDLSEFAGMWTKEEAAEFDRNIHEMFETIDEEMWKA